MANYEFEAKPTLVNNVVKWELCVIKPQDQAACGDGRRTIHIRMSRFR